MKKLLLILIILTMSFNLEANIFSNLFKGEEKNIDLNEEDVNNFIMVNNDIVANNIIDIEMQKADDGEDIYIISFYFKNRQKLHLILDKKIVNKLHKITKGVD